MIFFRRHKGIFSVAVRFCCVDCGKTYMSMKSLQRHRNFECEFTGPKMLFKCPMCDYHCKRKDNLKLHTYTHFPESRRHDDEEIEYFEYKKITSDDSLTTDDVILTDVTQPEEEEEYQVITSVLDVGNRIISPQKEIISYQRYEFHQDYINLCDEFIYDASDQQQVGQYSGSDFPSSQQPASSSMVTCNLYNYMYNSIEDSSGNSEDLKDQHDTRRRYSCPQCGTRFTLEKNMKRHYRYECGKEPMYQCPVCFVKFKRNNQLQNHIAKKHSNIGGS
ncbi:hypothetical protein DMENIID0001_125500 [Sergentomyia squamirostris]